MPSRIIRDGILTSMAVNQLSAGAEVFYRRILNVVDDFGRYHGTPALIRAAAYPLKIDTVSDKDIQRWLVECAQAGLVVCYSSQGLPYIEIVKFGTPRAKTSKFPQPETDENKCLHPHTDANNRTVVVVEDVVVVDSAKKQPRKRGLQSGDLQIPSDLDHHASAIRKWVDYRFKRKPPIYDYSIEAAYAEWRKFGDTLPLAIDKAIASGWQGLHAVKDLHDAEQEQRPWGV